MWLYHDLLAEEGMEMVNQIWDQYFNYSMYHKARLNPGIKRVARACGWSVAACWWRLLVVCPPWFFRLCPKLGCQL